MSLSLKQRVTLQLTRPHSIVFPLGNYCGLLWSDPDAPPRERWRGQLAKEVRQPTADEAGRFLAAGVSIADLDHIVVWSGTEIVGRTRRAVRDALRAEALA